jgi:BirA family transcriptional regulator, biotin operon repressor / biotin---[acetyl-CoA-carboxylase] ligase
MHKFELHSYDTLKSTNDKARELAIQGYSNIAVSCKKQTSGRGRFDRIWESEEGGIYLTFLLKDKDLAKSKFLTFSAALSVIQLLSKEKIKGVVKWPNDIFVEGKKISGILTETFGTQDHFILVGIGLNVNQEIFSGKTNEIATSMRIVSGKMFNISNIIKILIDEFEIQYSVYNKGDFSTIINAWEKNSNLMGRLIKVSTISGEFIGEAIDINKDCNLVLRTKSGKLKTIIEGDISLA